MKRWLVVTVLGVAAGCQAGAPATATQEIAVDDCYGEANFCNATMPPTKDWLAGEPLPQSTVSTVVVLRRESAAVWRAYGADPVLAQVLWQRTVKSASVSALMAAIANSNRAQITVRPPPAANCPPICIDNPGFILAYAKRTLPIQAQAEADVGACPIN